MRVHIVSFLLLAFMLCAIVSDSESQPIIISGKDWQNRKLLKMWRIGVIEGFYDGVTLGVIKAGLQSDMPGKKRTEILADAFPSRYTVAHTIKAVDQFYSDYRNINIPVGTALGVITKELRGEDKEIMDLLLRQSRAHWSKYEKEANAQDKSKNQETNKKEDK